MKAYIIPLLFLSLSACTENKSITFYSHQAQAVLVGQQIDLLDNDLKPKEDISHLHGSIVDIVGISDSLINLTDEKCDAFWFVKIKSGDQQGIVNGRQVYQIKNTSRDTSFTSGGNQFEIKATEFLGIGIADKNGLIGCPEDQPVLIKDKKNNYFGLIELKHNAFSKQANKDGAYPFFELKSDMGYSDKITSIIADDTKIRIKIHRRHQEGANDYEVLLVFKHGTYTAEYLSYGEWYF